MNNEYTAFAMETVTVTSANVAATLSASKYNRPGMLPARMAHVTINPGPIVSYTIDGTTVSSQTGHQIASFGVIELSGYTSIKNFQSTSVSSATATKLTVTYFR